jgi:hypothetical protein
MDHLTDTGTEVPVYSKLLAIWSAGTEKVWNTERVVANDQTNQPLSSVGRAWVRSGSLAFGRLRLIVPSDLEHR